MAEHYKRCLKDVVKVIGSGSIVFVSYLTAIGDERFYANQLMPLLQRTVGVDAAHLLMVRLIGLGLVPGIRYQDPVSLEVKVMGHRFQNPLGLLTDFSRHSAAIDGLYRLGFGFVEVETADTQAVSTVQRAGSRYKPSCFVCAAVQERLKAREAFQSKLTTAGQPMGINLGQSDLSQDPVAEVTEGVQVLGPLADYLVVNVSRPSSPDSRVQMGKGELRHLLDVVLRERDTLPCERRPPVLVRITSDLPTKDKQDVADVITELGLDGLVVSSSAISRPVLDPEQRMQQVTSGQTTKELSSHTVREMYSLTEGKVPIIGAGGVASGRDALDMIRAGASLVQLRTAFKYQGPPVAMRIKRELLQLLKEQGFKCVSEAVGADVKTGGG
ncbi:dihydroorotate dehydrogenase (quinone), mitochondrial [Paramormyrops kingsleyae]|uniref:dihydroorotate dehydrogenase (quinone), mitochondrial n=1 Tax=Paramormyrops kingsleyae TaxID=1676925 RepID=UPI003B978955